MQAPKSAKGAIKALQKAQTEAADAAMRRSALEVIGWIYAEGHTEAAYAAAIEEAERRHAASAAGGRAPDAALVLDALFRASERLRAAREAIDAIETSFSAMRHAISDAIDATTWAMHIVSASGATGEAVSRLAASHPATIVMEAVARGTGLPSTRPEEFIRTMREALSAERCPAAHQA